MGRGGGRTRASGGTVSQDTTLTYKNLALNMSLSQFLISGYFEKDLLSYCANRLMEYSCTYFFDPSVDGLSDTVDLYEATSEGSMGHTPEPNTQWTKYPSHFVSQAPDAQAGEFTLIGQLTKGNPIRGTFLGPLRFRPSTEHANLSTVSLLEYQRFPLNTVAQIIIPFLIIMACLSNLFILRVSYKLSFRRLPIAVYFVYISLFDQLDLLVRGTDYLVEAYGGIRLFTAMQFVSRSSCQLLSMAHNAMRHLQATLLIGLAIDLCRWSVRPVRFWMCFRSEWTQNLTLLGGILAIILDSQFLWTFDLSLSDITHLHGRPVQNVYQCGYSQASTLSPLFLYYLWPITDHLWGDVLPCLTCIAAATFTLIVSKARRRRLKTTHSITQYWTNQLRRYEPDESWQSCCPPEVYWIDLDLIMQTIRAFAMVVLTNGIFTLPRCFYYLVKYTLFTDNRFHKTATAWSKLDANGYGSQGQNTFPDGNHTSYLHKYESSLEAIEFVLRCLGAVNTITCTIILLYKMTPFRQELVIYKTKIVSLLHRSNPKNRVGSPRKTQKQHLIESEKTKPTEDKRVEVIDAAVQKFIAKQEVRKNEPNRKQHPQNQTSILKSTTNHKPNQIHAKLPSTVESNSRSLVGSTQPTTTRRSSRTKTPNIYSL